MPQGQYNLADAKPIGAYSMADARPADTPEPSGPISRAASEFYAKSPLGPAVDLLSGAAHVVAHPLDTYFGLKPAAETVKGLAKAQWDQAVLAAQKAKEATQGGGLLSASEAFGHGLAAVLPVLGPAAADVGMHGAQGDLAGMAGGAAGLLSPFAVHAAGGAVPDAAKAALADSLDRGANTRVAKVISPTVGANKIRFGNQAAEVAPQVARETSGLTRTSISDSVAAKLEDATAGLDAATDARLNAKSYETTPVLKALKAKRDRLTAQAVEGSVFEPQSGVNRPPLGADVVPTPNAARVAQIDQATKEIQQLGPTARYEALRRMREAYDGPAKAVYSPAMTADYMTAQGGKLGAADVTGALRDHLAQIDPATATANASYSLWKKASDVLQAAEETERVRPTVGRSMLARGLAAGAGGAAGGGLGAAVGAIMGPMIERGFTNIRPALQMVAARQMANLADALRAGDIGKVKANLSTLQKMAPEPEGGQFTEPGGAATYQAPTTAAAVPQSAMEAVRQAVRANPDLLKQADAASAARIRQALARETP